MARLNQNLTELIDGTKKIWDRLAANVVKINGQQKNINGNVGMLFAADGVTPIEKTILRAYLNTTASIAGCQQIRKKIGACCFGFRVVQGECIFVTVSPNRRHSSMVLKLSRVRRGDTGVSAKDATSQARHKHADPSTPKIFSATSLSDDPDGTAVVKEIPLPPILVRQAWNAQDPLASVYHYLMFMYVVLPALFGIRMCLRCPDCNADDGDLAGRSAHFRCNACSDYLGCNSKCLGGFAGLASGMASATEFQGEGTPHGHGFVSLANMYQHHTLEEIGQIIEANLRNISPEIMLKRVLAFIEHLQREDHFRDDLHQQNLANLEKEFHNNNEGPPRNHYLSVRPRGFYEQPGDAYLWEHPEANKQAKEEAATFQNAFETDVQFIFSHVQHHWHQRNDRGKRVPMKYCKPSSPKSKRCKRDFPKKVLRDREGKLRMDRYRARLVCRGVAGELELRVSGRRNALGSVAGRRRCEYFSGTAAILAHVTRSNTNLQCNYRIPITPVTHDKDIDNRMCIALHY